LARAELVEPDVGFRQAVPLVEPTVAPGMTPLAVSVTTPEMVEVEPPCAYASTDVRPANRAQSAHTARLRDIVLLPAAWFFDQAVPPCPIYA
jgi:hypothetical protein